MGNSRVVAEAETPVYAGRSTSQPLHVVPFGDLDCRHGLLTRLAEGLAGGGRASAIFSVAT